MISYLQITIDTSTMENLQDATATEKPGEWIDDNIDSVNSSSYIDATATGKPEEWIENIDSFNSSSSYILTVSRIIICYKVWTHQERRKKINIENVIYIAVHTHIQSFVFHRFRMNGTVSYVSTMTQTEQGGKITPTG